MTVTALKPATPHTLDQDTILDVRNLQTHFFVEGGVVKAVDGVTFALKQRHTLGVVGESGCGKSVTAMSIMRLVRYPPGRIVGGEILLRQRDGATTDIAKLDSHSSRMRQIRGGEIAMIFQEPMTSLNPLYTVGDQIAEAVQLHQKVGKDEALKRALEMLQSV